MYVYRWEESEGVEAESEAQFENYDDCLAAARLVLGDSDVWWIAHVDYDYTEEEEWEDEEEYAE